MQTKEIDIRIATLEDLDDIVKLWMEMIDFHAQRDSFFTHSEDAPYVYREFIASIVEKQDDAFLIVAEEMDSKLVVGFCLGKIEDTPPVYLIKKKGELHDIAVTSEYRRQGVGKKLFKRARELFRQKGIVRMELVVAVTNEISSLFWQKMGFNSYMNVMHLSIS